LGPIASLLFSVLYCPKKQEVMVGTPLQLRKSKFRVHTLKCFTNSSSFGKKLKNKTA
jgi:uncharacterized Zn finger protein